MAEKRRTARWRFISRKTFVKTALVVVVLVCVATVFSMNIGLTISTNYILNASRNMRRDMLDVYQQNMQQKLSSLFQSVNLLLLDTEVEEFMYASSDEPDFLLVRTVLQKLKSNFDIDPIVDSIYIFDREHDYVLADGFYRKEVFHDAAVFTDDFIRSAPISGVRHVDGKQLFSFIFQPLTTPIQNPTTIVVNVMVDRIAAMLPTPKGLGDFVLVNERREVLYTSFDQAVLLPMLDEICALEGDSGVIESEDRIDYLATSTMPNTFGTRLLLLHRYDLATGDEVILRALIMPSLLGALVGLAALALLASIYLYHPLNKTVNRLVKQGYSPKNINEYAVIDHAVNQLETSQRETEARYNEASRIRDQYYLQEFLISPVINREKFNSLLDRMQLVFDMPCFSIIVMDLHDRTNENSRPIPMPDASLFPPSFKVIANQIGKERIACVLNFPNSSELAPELTASLKIWFNEQAWDVCMFCCSAFDSLDELPQHYNLSDQMLEQRFFLGYDVVLEPGDFAADQVGDSARMEHELLLAVKACNELRAQQILSNIIADCGAVSSTDATEMVKFRLTELCVRIITESRSSAAPIEDIAALPSYAHFLAICHAKTLRDIHDALFSAIRASVEQLSRVAQHRNEQLVQRAKDYIGANLTNNMALDDIAKSVYLSTNYFSSIFKTETGITVMDYVIKRRIELACEILKQQPDLKINALAAQLGYNNVQSFIRQFKKITQVTPDKFRKDNT